MPERTAVLDFVQFVYKIMKLSGFHFTTYAVTKKGYLVKRITLIDLAHFTISISFTFFLVFFFDYSIGMQQFINSNVMGKIIDSSIYFGIFSNFPLRISTFIMQNWVLNIFNDILKIGKLVSTHEATVCTFSINLT